MTAAWLAPDDARWAAVLDAVPHDVYHRPAYVRFAARHEGGEGGAVLVEADGARLLLPLVVRPIDGTDGRTDAATPYGYPGPLVHAPGGDAEAFLSRAVPAMLAALRARGGVALFARLHPLLPVPAGPLERAGQLVHHGDTVALDLSVPEDEAWGALRANHRRQIRRARRAGYAVEAGPAGGHLDAFVALYHATMRRAGAAPGYFFPTAYFADLAGALGPDLHLLRAVKDGRTACAGLFSTCGGVAQYLFSGTHADDHAFQPLKLLLDAARGWARARGLRRLHLGGGLGGREDSLFHFKVGFGGRRAPFHTWRVIVDPAAYDQLCAARGGAAASGADSLYFPRYRAPGTDRAAT